MGMFTKLIRLASVGVLLVLLAACGGDGDGGELSSDAKLAQLSLSAGFLSTPFDSERSGYAAEVDPRAGSIRVIAISRDGGATIEINGNQVTSGESSDRIPLEQGASTEIAVQVNSEDGSNSETYRVEVFRPFGLDVRVQPGKATLEWDDVGAHSYNLYYATEPGCDIENYSVCSGGAMVSGVTTPHTVSGLTNGQNYWFQIEPTEMAVPYEETGARPDALSTNWGVNAIAHGPDGTAYLGGEFSYIGMPRGHGFFLNRFTGTVQAFPTVDGTVHAAVADSVGGVYIGGPFTNVGGESRDGLAYIRPDGTVGAWNPGSVDGYVLSLAMADNTIYAGGQFDAIGGVRRNLLAAIGTDGHLKDWDPGLDIDRSDGRISALAVAGDVIYAGTVVFADNTDFEDHSYHLATFGTDGTSLRELPLDGRAEAMTVLDGTLYLGGAFRSVNGKSRDGLAAIVGDGRLTDWNPGVNGAVNALAVSDGTVYAAGVFDAVDGESRTSLVAFDAVGAITSWNPQVGRANGYATVKALTVVDDTVYLAGSFGEVAGEPRNHFAAIGTDGSLQSWAPSSASGTRVLVSAKEGLYAGGLFATVGGEPREGLAAIRADGTLADWNPNGRGDVFWGSSVDAVVVSNDTVYFGGDFEEIGGEARSDLAAVGTDGALREWSPSIDWGEVSSLAVSNETVYVGGRFEHVNGTPRSNLAAFGTDGALTDWAPETNRSVETLVVLNDVVYVGGSFFNVNGQTRHRLAAIGSNGRLTDWTPGVNGRVNALTVSDGTVYAGGVFDAVDGESRTNLVAFDAVGAMTSWNPQVARANGYVAVNALTVSDSTVYVGGSFSEINSETRECFAAIRADGSLAAWNPDVTTRVSAIAVHNGMVDVGGGYRCKDGQRPSRFDRFEGPD